MRDVQAGKIKIRGENLGDILKVALLSDVLLKKGMLYFSLLVNDIITVCSCWGGGIHQAGEGSYSSKDHLYRQTFADFAYSTHLIE